MQICHGFNIRWLIRMRKCEFQTLSVAFYVIKCFEKIKFNFFSFCARGRFSDNQLIKEPWNTVIYIWIRIFFLQGGLYLSTEICQTENLSATFPPHWSLCKLLPYWSVWKNGQMSWRCLYGHKEKRFFFAALKKTPQKMWPLSSRGVRP